MVKKQLSEHDAARQWRENLGLTRAALSELSGYSQQSIADYELGYQTNGKPIDSAAFKRFKLACAAVHAGLSFDWSKVELEHVRKEKIII